MTRADYTKKAQKAYYDRIRADPVKWRAHLDKCKIYQQRRKEKKQQQLLKLKEEKEKEELKISLEDKKNELKELIEKGLIKIQEGSIILG